MPKFYPEWPSGEQMQAYFESYVEKFGFREIIKLNTEVVSTKYIEERKVWEVSTNDLGEGVASCQHFDFLIVCNGIFSKPKVAN